MVSGKREGYFNNDPHSLGLRGEREDMENVIGDDRAVGGSQLHGVQISLQ